MYHLVKSLYLHATSKEEYSLLLLGLDAAGKTTLLNQIKSIYLPPSTSTSTSTSSTPAAPPPPPKQSNPPPPTVGQNLTTLSLPDMYLRIWDVGGHPPLRRLWPSYYASAHAIVFVLDATDAALATRLDEARRVLADVLRHDDVGDLPVLVLANKRDRDDWVEVVRVKEGLVRWVVEREGVGGEEDGEGDGERAGRTGGGLGGVRDSRVLPVSALEGTGVKEAVEWVRTRVQWNRDIRPPVMR
ncbi:MAG: ADP-ribosylation factor protein 3 [Piccolia ochrophora]|nr:MAG: ADP-ribosylation factor protein 3 [Piccolia ochrophora]